MKVIETRFELKRAMKRAKLRRKDVANALDITPQAVYKWLTGRSPLPRYAGLWFYYEHGITKDTVKR